MPSPNSLTPYISPPKTAHTLTLLTSLLCSPSSWLTHTLLATHLTSNASILLISLTQDRAFHVDGLRKLGVPLHYLDRSEKFTFLGITDSASALTRNFSTTVLAAVESAARASGDRGEEVVVVLESLDLLLQIGGGGGYVGLMELVLRVQEVAEHTVVSVNVDEALMRDEEHAAFVIGLGHVARRVFGLRGLETGIARDVSGVLRITAGGMGGEDEGKGDGGKEVLYFVGDGGGVEVFERGEVRGG
ncbi:hypothetical protein HOY80DRAFT_1134149 [Tuber brumale]|nr:hypothetical protein HOY80DRAFT_1134149 [Tuber brumale]